MVVVRIVDDRHVLVCDGEAHPAARPKRKNIRHLAGAAALFEPVAQGDPADDAALREWLVRMCADREPGPRGGDGEAAAGTGPAARAGGVEAT
jgi:hypothetical protein